MIFDQGAPSFGLPASQFVAISYLHASFADGNGVITPLELKTLMKGILGDGSPPEEEIQSIIRSVDADGSGTIDFGEFLTLMSDPKFKDPAKDEHREAFEMFDTDGSGHISITELKEAFKGLGEPC